MGTFATLSNSLRQQAKNIKSNTSLLVRRCATVVIEELAVRTPIDSGRAKSNWIVTLNSPTVARIEPHHFGVLGSTAPQTIKTVQARAAIVINRFKIGDTVIIQNNLDYIDDLEKGSSKQSPAGFIHQSLARIPLVVQGTQILRYNGVSK